MAMAEPRDWQQDDDRTAPVEQRLRVAEEQRVQAEGRCFAAERRRLDAERKLAEAEALLQAVQATGERTRKLVVELIALAAELRASIDRAPVAAPSPQQDAAERAQMADALAAAVERLRARLPNDDRVDDRSFEVELDAAAPSTQERPQAPAAAARAAVTAREPHKHSMSAITRWRYKRKQRRCA